MGADNTYGENTFNPDFSKCNGEWKNDCPYPECWCAKKALDDMREMEEDYSKESVATAYGFFAWLIFAVLLLSVIIGLIWGS